MTPVTYVVASSSYHSIRSLRECANLSEVSAEVQRAILKDFYVVDILTAANSIDEARIVQKQLVETLKRGSGLRMDQVLLLIFRWSTAKQTTIWNFQTKTIP